MQWIALHNIAYSAVHCSTVYYVAFHLIVVTSAQYNYGALQLRTLQRIAADCSSVRYSVVLFIGLHDIAVRLIALLSAQYIALHYIALLYISVHCSGLRFSVHVVQCMDCTPLHWIVLRCFAVQCSALRYSPWHCSS